MPRTMVTTPGHDLLVYCLGMENRPLLAVKRPTVVVNYLSKGQPCGKRVKGCSWAELPRPGFYRLGLPVGIWEDVGTDLSLQLLAPGLQSFFFRPYLRGIERVELPTPPQVTEQIKNGEMKPKGAVLEAPEFTGSRRLRLDMLRERGGN